MFLTFTVFCYIMGVLRRVVLFIIHKEKCFIMSEKFDKYREDFFNSFSTKNNVDDFDDGIKYDDTMSGIVNGDSVNETLETRAFPAVNDDNGGMMGQYDYQNDGNMVSGNSGFHIPIVSDLWVVHKTYPTRRTSILAMILLGFICITFFMY